MTKIIIQPWAKPLRNGEVNPKNYTYRCDLVAELSKTMEVIQIGTDGENQLVPDFRKNLSIEELTKLIRDCDTWIGVDSFFQHLCWYEGKKGIVLRGQGDPKIFGHKENLNLLKDETYLRQHQFQTWEECTFNAEAFVKPDIVLKELAILLKKIK